MKSDKLIENNPALQHEIRTCPFRDTAAKITPNSICTIYHASCMAAIGTGDCVQMKKKAKKG